MSLVKQYYFMAGLPRSGGTLLKSILNQNPNIHTNPVSPVLELMYYTDEYFLTSESFLAYPKPKAAHKMISSIIEKYYSDVEKPIVIEHNRAWPNNIERIKTYITPKPKIICTVRDVLEILTSFVTLIHKNGDEVNFIDKELIKSGCTVDDHNRCLFLMSPNGIVDQALWALAQAFIRNDNKYLLLVDYNDLVNTPEKIMTQIYDFLEIDHYSHDFNNVENDHQEQDQTWNLKDMHHVRKKVEKKSLRPEEVLPLDIINKYNKLEYWKYSDSPYLKRWQ